MIVDSAGRGGATDEMHAVRDLIPSLVEDGTIPQGQLEDALGRRAGPSSYDPASGELRIDGLIQADIGVGQLSDGTWGIAGFEQCMRPPTSSGS